MRSPRSLALHGPADEFAFKRPDGPQSFRQRHTRCVRLRGQDFYCSCARFRYLWPRSDRTSPNFIECLVRVFCLKWYYLRNLFFYSCFRVIISFLLFVTKLILIVNGLVPFSTRNIIFGFTVTRFHERLHWSLLVLLISFHYFDLLTLLYFIVVAFSFFLGSHSPCFT